jgi:2'-5' RNA ligase
MRLFVAITLDETVRSVLARFQEGLKAGCPGVRWVAPALFHLTAKFMGEVDDRRVAEVSQAVERAAASVEPFGFELTGCGCFPRRGGVRVIWVGTEEPTGRLAACVEAIEKEMEAIGFDRERRPFSAHLTLGRVREDRSGGRIRDHVASCSFAPTPQSVESLTLMSSVLSPKGPTYTPVGVFQLGREPVG